MDTTNNQSSVNYPALPSLDDLMNQQQQNPQNSGNQHITQNPNSQYQFQNNQSLANKPPQINVQHCNKQPLNIVTTKPIQKRQNKPSKTANYTMHSKYEEHFTEEEISNQKVAASNKTIVLSKKFPIVPSELITDSDYNDFYNSTMNDRSILPPNMDSIFVNTMSTIGAAIEIHKKYPSDQICILNFADAFKCGGGYLNGRLAQEETLCRQTLLYPTLVKNDMYTINASDKTNVLVYDTMIYSPDVFVIRDDNYDLLNEKSFKVNIISAAAVDKRRKNLHCDAEQIMERRIRKIILLAAFKKNDVIILGAFGCGVFRNDPFKISQIFRKVLIDECLANYFKVIVFPIYKSEKNFSIFYDVLIKEKILYFINFI